MSRTSHLSLRRLATTLGVIVLLASTILVIGVGSSSAGEKMTKLERQIDVMEGAIDDMLVDSPNFLVHGGDNARGLYIDEFGVIFTFDASLVSEKAS